MGARAIGLALALLAGACGDEPVASTTQEQRYEVVTHVQDSGGGPELCVFAVAESLPPQCGGLPVTPFSWDDVEGEQSRRGITWLEHVRVVGTWDGTTFRLTEPPRAVPRPEPSPRPEYPLPCPEPAGGWRVVDRSKAGEDDQNAAVGHARGARDVAGIWLHWLREPTDEEARDGRIDYTQAVVVLTFTGDVARHAREARERWGGPLCVAERPHSYAELEDAGTRLAEESRKAGLGRVYVSSGGADEPANVIEVTVLVDDAATRRWVEERVGGLPVAYRSILEPV